MSKPKGSFVRAGRYLVRNWKLSCEERMLLFILRSYCFRGDECWPSAETLARDLGKTPRTVFRIAKGLQRAGYITRRAKEPGNSKSPTVYTLFDKQAEERLQKLADPKRKLVTPMSAKSLTPMSHEVEEVKGDSGGTPKVGEAPNVIQMPKAANG